VFGDCLEKHVMCVLHDEITEKFEHTKDIIRSHKSEYNNQRKKYKGTKLRSNKHKKTKDWAIRIPRKTGEELRCSGRVSN